MCVNSEILCRNRAIHFVFVPTILFAFVLWFNFVQLPFLPLPVPEHIIAARPEGMHSWCVDNLHDAVMFSICSYTLRYHCCCWMSLLCNSWCSGCGESDTHATQCTHLTTHIDHHVCFVERVLCFGQHCYRNLWHSSSILAWSVVANRRMGCTDCCWSRILWG
jgi:hypothetical protein